MFVDITNKNGGENSDNKTKFVCFFVSVCVLVLQKLKNKHPKKKLGNTLKVQVFIGEQDVNVPKKISLNPTKATLFSVCLWWVFFSDWIILLESYLLSFSSLVQFA